MHTTTLAILFHLLAIVVIAHNVNAQCGTCGSVPCATQCEVTCQSELQAALACLANPSTNTCTQIVIPAGCVVNINTQINIGSAHSGTVSAPNRITIQGTVKWTGTPHADSKLFSLSGVQNFVFDGGGLITSDYDPADYNCEYPCGIARAFNISGSSPSNITIRDLTVTNMGSVIETGAVTNLHVVNVHGTNIVNYGFWSGDRITAMYENTSITKTYVEHPFRLYATNVSIKNCWSYGSAKTGLWAVEGDNVTVDRFASDTWLRFGPNYEIAGSSPLTDVFAQELHYPGTSPKTTIEMGVVGGCFINLCSNLEVGRSDGQVVHDLPLDDVHWSQVSGTVTIVSNPNMGSNVGSITYNYCWADINRTGEVDVDDLLAVINAWGPCPAPPSGYSSPYPPCAADIVPNI